MRAKGWLGPVTAALLGGGLAAACAAPGNTPQGIAEAGDGLLTLSTRGPSPAAAVERGLNQASQHCADQSRMISVQSTRIERDAYHLAFRCLSVPGGMVAAAPMAAPAPVAASALPAGQAAPPPLALPQAAPAPAPAPAPETAGLPLPAASAARPVSPGGMPLPMANSALPPIAGGTTSARPATGLAPSSFWQAGR